MNLEDQITVIAEPMENEYARVSLEYIGEGWSGEYNPDDEDDVPLLRLDLLAYKGYQGFSDEVDEKWVYPWDGSICTSLHATAPLEEQQAFLASALEFLSDIIQANGSVRKAMDSITWWV